MSADGLWVQQLSAEHEAKLAELGVPASAGERRLWDASAVAEFRRREGITEHVDYAAAEQVVEETRMNWRVQRRELSADEVALVRRQAEMRSVVTTAAQPPLSTSWELAGRHGWGVAVDARKGTGFAMKLNGEWSPDSDPAVVSAATEAEEAKRRQAEVEYANWRSGPAVLRTVAGPS